jgi:hypothetical protein
LLIYQRAGHTGLDHLPAFVDRISSSIVHMLSSSACSCSSVFTRTYLTNSARTDETALMDALLPSSRFPATVAGEFKGSTTVHCDFASMMGVSVNHAHYFCFCILFFPRSPSSLVSTLNLSLDAAMAAIVWPYRAPQPPTFRFPTPEDPRSHPEAFLSIHSLSLPSEAAALRRPAVAEPVRHDGPVAPRSKKTRPRPQRGVLPLDWLTACFLFSSVGWNSPSSPQSPK